MSDWNRLSALPVVRRWLFGAIGCVALAIAFQPVRPVAQDTLSGHTADPHNVDHHVPAQRPPQAPADAEGAKAYRVLETHCARCHQGGQTTGPAPSADFGNILRLEELAADPSLVRPGNPDGSRLYTQMLRRLMPYDVYQEASGGAEPTTDDIAAVRDWIEKLPPMRACTDRRPVTTDDIAAALTKAAAANRATASRLRFLSLAGPYNACVSPEQMSSYRQALGQSLNSLSWKAQPVRLVSIDESHTLYQVDLESLGWLPAHWDRIMRSDPGALGLLADLPPAARAPFASERPVARADWFADTALSAPLYYDLLGLPTRGSELGRILHVNLERARDSNAVIRQTLDQSRFARGPRLIERLKPPGPSYWSTFEKVASPGPAVGETADSAAAQPEEGLTLFTLPNGFPGFFIRNAKGERIDRIPTGLAKGTLVGDDRLAAGLGCLSCHSDGPRRLLHPPSGDSEVDRLIMSDRAAVVAAHEKAGLAGSSMMDGVPPVIALARHFERDLGFMQAAAELGVAPERLAAVADEPETAGKLARQLVQGTVPRAEFDAGFATLLNAIRKTAPPSPSAGGALATTAAPAVSVGAEARDPGPQIKLLTDKVSYKAGDLLRLTVSASADCYMTVINIDSKGRGTVIYPSDFESSNLVLAGREVTVPADGAPYRFRMKQPGSERFIAICNTANSAVDGIRHDFERQRFTDLGNYTAFVAEASKATSLAAQSNSPAPRPEPKRRGRARAAKDHAEAHSDAKSEPGQITQTAIIVDVR